MFQLRIVVGAALCLSVGLSGCIGFRSTEGPMQILEDRLACEVRPKTLVVFLPGAREVPQDLVNEGFVKALRDRHIQADMQILDSHYGYFSSLQIIDRLEKEVVLPARAKGYTQIWFSGISLGGFGTLIYGTAQAAAKIPDPRKMFNGFFVMAPYMGEKSVWQSVQTVGLKNWVVPANKTTESANGVSKDFSTDLWRWLSGYATEKNNLPTAYIGYGTEDFLAPPNKVFGDVLPAQRRFEVPGGHDWPPWKILWARWLDQAPLARAANASQLCVY